MPSSTCAYSTPHPRSPDIADFGPNPKAVEFGDYGVCYVRHGKVMDGSHYPA